MEQRKYGTVPVVLLLDISNIVKGEAFSQMKEAFVSLIKGKSNVIICSCTVFIIQYIRILVIQKTS